MFKHTVTYADFNGVNHVEDLYFHMMVPEFADLEFNPVFETTLSDYIKEGMRSGEGRKIHTVFKLVVANSYGRRSEDGSRFTKNAAWTEEFLNSNAWEQFFLWLTDTSDMKNGQTFFNAIFPEAMRAQVEELRAKQIADENGQTKTVVKNIDEMTPEELQAALRKRAGGNTIEA